MAETTMHHEPCGPWARRSFLTDLEGQPAFGFIGPNWFASVMGTAIIPVALEVLPFDLPGRQAAAVAVWVVAVVLLVAVTAATLVHHRRHPGVARGHLDDPTMSHFYGAPAMGLMAVGAATLLAGERVIGLSAALAVDGVLWTLGTALGLVTAVVVPYRAFIVHDVAQDVAFGGWLMPVVPPMVSAATGAMLVPHLPAGQAQETMLLACYAFFGLTLLASVVIIAFIWNRLLRHGPGAAGAVPTVWIVLGPLGQSVTAAHNLGLEAPDVLPEPFGRGFEAFALVYGLPVWGFAMLWMTIALMLTVRQAREHLPFTLTWWSFTFPVGTVVTGTAGLADLTGLVVLDVATGVLFAGLLAAWAVVAVRTLRGVWTGFLLRAPITG